MPVPRTGAGMALKRAPSTGTADRLVMCSTIGMPARSSSEWAGRSGSVVEIDVERVDPHERGAGGDQQLHRVEREERVVAQVVLRPPEAVEAGVDEDRSPGEIERSEGVGVDGGGRAGGRVDPHRRQVHQALEGQRREVRPVLPAVERAVHVRAGVAAQRDQVDLERHARGVSAGARGAIEDRVDLGHGQARIGDHAGLDGMAEIDDSRGHGASLSPHPIVRTRHPGRAYGASRPTIGFTTVIRLSIVSAS